MMASSKTKLTMAFVAPLLSFFFLFFLFLLYKKNLKKVYVFATGVNAQVLYCNLLR